MQLLLLRQAFFSSFIMQLLIDEARKRFGDRIKFNFASEVDSLELGKRRVSASQTLPLVPLPAESYQSHGIRA